MKHKVMAPNGAPSSTGKSTTSQKQRGQNVPGKPRKLHDGLAILDRIIGNDPEVRREMERERERLNIARVIYDARARAGLTQAELARKARTTQSVVARLEDADYQGHSMRLLQRIAEALECRVSIILIPRIRGVGGIRRSIAGAKDS